MPPANNATHDSPGSPAQLAGIHVYPVKSCAGIALESSQITRTGLALDRRWMLVDEAGRFISQREVASMALIRCELIPGGVRVEADGLAALDIPLEMDAAPEKNVQLHGQSRLARDRGEEAAQWFGEAIGRHCRLVEAIPHADPWTIHEPEGEGETTYFPDLYPLLVTSKETLDALFPDGRTGMERFRPNLVLAGASAFAEDGWESILIGDQARIKQVKPCARCVITTIDPAKGVRQGQEPLRTLAARRSWRGKAVFGWNALVETPSTVSIGDQVTCLVPRREPEPIGEAS